jgi:tRNA dimethylallyltransferase
MTGSIEVDMTKTPPRATLIAGPTASGKSALALRIARERNGVVINADSMQVYSELRILTARPSAEEELLAPHRLYGHVPAAAGYSVARWLDDMRAVLAETDAAGCHPVVVGGTGLYFKALLEGLSPVPAIPDEVRRRWRDASEQLGAPGLYDELVRRDPEMAGRLSPRDRQRVTRALEVIDATGCSLATWQAIPGEGLLRAEDCDRLLIGVSREELNARCDRRLDQMMAAGAMAEVQRLAALGLDPSLPAMQALGVPSLMAAVAARVTCEAALADAKLRTRQYAKRQVTWFRRHMNAWRIVNKQ